MTNIQTRNLIPGFVLLAAVSVLSAAYSAQIVGGVRPCVLCLYSRIPWFAAGGLSLLVVLMAFSGPLRRLLMLLAALALLGGALLSGYHVGVEQHMWAGPGTCSAPETMPMSLDQLNAMLQSAAQPRCDSIPWQMWGISLAGFNTIIASAVGLIALAGARRRG